MQNEDMFGKQIAEYSGGEVAKARRRNTAVALAMVFFAIAFLLVLAYPGEGERLLIVIDEGMALLLIILCFFLGVATMVSALRHGKPCKAIIYENGISYTYGNTVTNLGFDDTEGVKIVSLTIGGISTNAGNVEQVALKKKDGSQ
ncbi:MAG: hypothetical protein FWG10_10160 [Eubacteriaceae bacterium]|nr:hypothetical protein [Eubacteriaceae bacterium]